MLIDIWSEVNALGGTVRDGNDYERGYCEAIAEVLDILEHAGITEETPVNRATLRDQFSPRDPDRLREDREERRRLEREGV